MRFTESAGGFFRMVNDDVIFWPIERLTESYRRHEVSPVEVTSMVLDRITQFNKDLNSYLTVTPELALEQARDAEARYRRVDTGLPPLLGVPASIKDLFDVRGVATSLGSRVYGKTVAQTDSLPVDLLRSAGSVFLGKSNTAEFGQSATTDNLLGPECRNPWDPTRTSGGSSGGAAASVGAGLASFALGSDGGGSIRIPAAMCGLFGIKPTFVRAPESESFHGMTAFVGSGPITRTSADARLVLSVLLQRDLRRGPRGVRRRIAWCGAPEGHPVAPGIRRCNEEVIKNLADLGHEIYEVPLPLQGWADAFGPLVLKDEAHYRQHLLEDDGEQLTFYARRAIEVSARVTDADVTSAMAMRLDVQRRVGEMLRTYDFIVTPTVATTAFLVGDRPAEIDGSKVDSLWGPFPFTAPFNVSGSPAATVPVGLVDGMPVGLQVVGPLNGEELVLDFCEDIEDVVSFTFDEMMKRWRSTVTQD